MGQKKEHLKRLPDHFRISAEECPVKRYGEKGKGEVGKNEGRRKTFCEGKERNWVFRYRKKRAV